MKWVVAAAVVMLIGLALRLDDLGARILSHPENLVPGIDLPDWATRPPERTTMRGVLVGTLADGHPPGYFVALLPWVKAFGTSLVSLRLPSALLGAASIYLVFLVGRRERSAGGALLAAALLAFHGFHIYWSQTARMYAPAAFMCLLSVLWLYRCLDRDRWRHYAIYFVITTASLWTQLYAWPFLAAQMIWVAAGIAGGADRWKALRVQFLAVVAGAPVVQLAMYQDPSSRWHQTAIDYFGFGYLFDRSLPFWMDQPWYPNPWLAVALCLLLIAAGLMALVASDRTPAAASADGAIERGGRAIEWVFAGAVTAFMLLLAWRWLGTLPKIWAVSALPLIVVAAGRFAEWVLMRWRARQPVTGAFAAIMRSLPQTPYVALLPVVMMAAVSLVRGVFVARGTVLYLPFLLLLVAYGLEYLLTRRPLAIRLAGVLAVAGTVLLYGYSIRYNSLAESSPRDYEGMASAIKARVAPGDLILVRNNYGMQPLFYYLGPEYQAQLVPGPGDYMPVIEERGASRAWLVWFCSQGEMVRTQAALSSLQLTEVVPVYAGELQLYLRDSLQRSVDPSRSAPPGFGCANVSADDMDEMQ